MVIHLCLFLQILLSAGPHRSAVRVKSSNVGLSCEAGLTRTDSARLGSVSVCWDVRAASVWSCHFLCRFTNASCLSHAFRLACTGALTSSAKLLLTASNWSVSCQVPTGSRWSSVWGAGQSELGILILKSLFFCKNKMAVADLEHVTLGGKREAKVWAWWQRWTSLLNYVKIPFT